MLASLAALIPILGSLYAGGSFLASLAKVDHELRVRQRIAPMVDDHYERVRDEQRVAAVNGRVDWDAITNERRRFEKVLLDANGISAPHPTYRDRYIVETMSAPLVPRAERSRQTVLLVSAVAGVVLLALDAL